MTNTYDPTSVEAKWQKKWEEAKAFNTDLKKAKDPFYGLVMFPYPSGDKLHVGHWYNFAPADSYFRWQRMKGHDTFTPMGFDAFGLPAENYAIKTGVPPAESIKKNVATMITQLKRMGCMYDWEKTVNTSDPEYYRWTQWLFLQMFDHDLAYKKEASVNWCPNCQTVLANEQVADGHCERCGTEVIQKKLNQWFWKTTQYAQRLLDGLDKLEWPEKTKLMQANWIGRSEGAEITFALTGHDETVKVYTTRPDTLFGVTYMVLAPEHPLVDVLTEEHHRGAVEAYKKEVAKKTELQRTDLNKEKSGVPLGSFAVNPATNERIPIWIADYVLAQYGTGAVMAVPAHDERDYDFAKKHDLPMKEVVKGGDVSQAAFAEEGVAMQSQFLDGLRTPEAKKKIIAWLEDEEKGRGVVQFRLKDWLVSRQRYWGAPIPIVYDPEGRPHPVPEKHLPWLLPTDVEFKPTGKSPLTESKEFVERTEKIFGKGWTPEYDTMDTFVCSSFYYLRYLMQGDPKKFVDPTLEKKWMPVSMYIGGPEHATMHLIYARFVMMALSDFGIVSHEEPFERLVHQGLITNGGAKMSKSKGNVVSPDSFVDRHGADVFRMYLMFMGPFTDGGDWSDTGIKGIDRFVQRVWGLFGEKPVKGADDDATVVAVLHKTIKRVTESVAAFRFNTAIAALMEFLNAVEGKAHSLTTARTFTRLLAPLAPHLAEELWHAMGGKDFVIDQPWPEYEAKYLLSDTLTVVVQVNGKLRGNIVVPSDAPEADVIARAKEDENVKKFLTGPIKKEIYVKGRLVNLVV
ncbi:MAG: leucine--tRNA ligase [Candidatus Peribacteraceae bacterium]|nr:leucine--tRNA ligase [Candidatus Peribacteraceae bacterium]